MSTAYTESVKAGIETDLDTIAGLTVLKRNVLNKDVVADFPSVSLIPISIQMHKYPEGSYQFVFRAGLAIYEESLDGTSLDTKLDLIFEDIMNCNFSTTKTLVESIDIVGYDYSYYNDETKGSAYVAIELTFN